MLMVNMPGFTADNSLYYTGRNFICQVQSSERSRSSIEPQLSVGGGDGLSNACDDKYGDCYIDCSIKYPEFKDSPKNLNSDLRAGCFDSCDAAHRVCKTLAWGTPTIKSPILHGVGMLAQ
jgi:hypothetical protein